MLFKKRLCKVSGPILYMDNDKIYYSDRIKCAGICMDNVATFSSYKKDENNMIQNRI